MNSNKNVLKLVGLVKYGKELENTKWTQIGVAFENRDGSYTLRFDYLPTNPDTGIQMRRFDTRPDDEQPPA